jgi:proteasome inhibitor subunit 1 (PI31)
LNDTIYIFHGLKTDENLLVNLLNGKTLETASLVFETDKIVKSTSGASIEDFITEFDNLIKRVDKEIIDEIKKEKPAAPSRSEDEDLHGRNSRRFMPYANPDPPSRDFRLIDPLRDIGRGDLNPLGVGGGMIFDPTRDFNNPLRIPGRFPPGHPPGARFDPINPLGGGGRLNPDPDHFRPPGPPPDGYDDMFM